MRNYVDGTPGSGADEDVTVVSEYTKGLRTKVKTDLPAGETDQETIYIYGSTKDTPAQMKIATGHLLRATKYPDTSNGGTTVANIDSDSSDIVSFAYDAQGRQTYKKDQAGNVCETNYDGSGRATQERVTTLASGFDGAIRRIATTYDSLGRTSEVVQYDNAAVGSGTAKDGVKWTYAGWGSVASYAEDRDSAVTGGGNQYTTSYVWAKATTGRNAVRKSDATLPSGRLLDYTYRTAGGLHDGDVSRVTFVMDGATALARYYYNGVRQIVAQQYDQPDMMWNQYGSSGTYPDLDNFNRVVKSRWTKDPPSNPDIDFYSVTLTYDRNSNITSTDDLIHSGVDVKYTMDNVDRLTRAHEGTLSAGTISPSTDTRDQQWTLSHTGNWEVDKIDLNGDDDYVDTEEVNDDRTHNAVNELTARDTDDNGTDNYTLTYDAAGNMTDDGKDYEYEYDAFYRLRKVKNTSNQNLVTEYRFNGLGHRIGVHEDTDTDGDVDANDKWYYDAFDEGWRHLARFRESDSSPKEDFVSHQAGIDGSGTSSYIDLLVCRNKDANTAWTSASDGNLEQRLYYCQNWRADVSALVKIVGSATELQEWGKYSAYGIPFGLPGGDTNSTGATDATDVTNINGHWFPYPPTYDVRADIDLSGAIESTDESTVSGSFSGITLGRGLLTSSGVGNRKGSTGYRQDYVTSSVYHVRLRNLSSQLGRWTQRDPLNLIGFGGLSEYGLSSPVDASDPSGAVPEFGRCKVAAVPLDGCVFEYSPEPLTIGNDKRLWRLTVSFGAYPDGTPRPGGEGYYSWNSDCGNSSCGYRLELILLPQFQDGPNWRSACSDAVPLELRNRFYNFWHGRGYTCSNPGGNQWPQWAGPHTDNRDGSSQLLIGLVPQDPYGRFDSDSLQCLDASVQDTLQPATPPWRIMAPSGDVLGFQGLQCRCGCGLFPHP